MPWSKDRVSIGAGRKEPGWLVGVPPELEAASFDPGPLGRERRSKELAPPHATAGQPGRLGAAICCFLEFTLVSEREFYPRVCSFISSTNICTLWGTKQAKSLSP